MSEKCLICNGKGLVVKEKDGVQCAYRCSCVEQKRLENILKNSRITPHFQKLIFENFDVEGKVKQVQDAHRLAVEYVKRFKEIRERRNNSIAFMGQPGTGKTHLSCAIANALMAKGLQVLYFPHREGFSELKSELQRGDRNNPESNYTAKIKAMKEMPLLVWDDLFKGGSEPTGYEMDVVFGVLNYRYLNHLPIVFSSERTIAELTQLDQAIGSRIHEMTEGRAVIFKKNIEINYRMSKAKRRWYSA